MSIIFIHELGHFLAAVYFKWDTDKIYFYPYGGYSKFNSDINKPLKEELIILIMGPLFQMLYYYIMMIFKVDFTLYHYGILIFNLLPIYPLDGGRLLNIVISYFFSYRTSYLLTIFISYIILLIIIFLALSHYFTLTIILMFILLVYKITESFMKRNYYFNKFFLERYIKYFSFKKVKIIKKIDDMQRDYKHVIKKKGNYYSEKEVLAIKYGKNHSL